MCMICICESYMYDYKFNCSTPFRRMVVIMCTFEFVANREKQTPKEIMLLLDSETSSYLAIKVMWRENYLLKMIFWEFLLLLFFAKPDSIYGYQAIIVPDLWSYDALKSSHSYDLYRHRSKIREVTIHYFFKMMPY